MPKATPAIRQSNAAAKALATVRNLSALDSSMPKAIKMDYAEFAAQKDPLPDEDLPAEEPAPEPIKEVKLSKAAPAVEPKPQEVLADPSKKRQPSEDFFDYMQRIDPEEWSNSQTSGLYVYKKSPKGNVRLTDEPLKCPLTLQELREQYLPVHGDGTYRLQFTTGLKHLTNCGENVTFDAQGVSLGGAPVGFLRGSSVAPGDSGFNDAIKATSEMLKDGAKAAVDVARAQQLENIKQPDVAAIITAVMTAMAAMQPKNDGDSALIKLLEGQRKDAEDRAKAAKEDAERQRQRDRDEAAAQRERDQQFFTMMKNQSDSMNTILLKQAESKSDSLSQMTNLITSFMTVREKIEDSLGGGQAKGWEGVVGQLIDRAPDAIAGVSAIMAARNGATPQQVQALTQNPQQAQQQPIENEFQELIHRIGRYMSRDAGLLQVEYLAGEAGDEDNDAIPGMIEVEYPSIFQALFVSQPKEAILDTINQTPIGKAILENQYGGPFLNKVIDSIKAQMVPAPEPEVIQPAKKPNGKAKVVA